jgi:hypothetical protein
LPIKSLTTPLTLQDDLLQFTSIDENKENSSMNEPPHPLHAFSAKTPWKTETRALLQSLNVTPFMAFRQERFMRLDIETKLEVSVKQTQDLLTERRRFQDLLKLMTQKLCRAQQSHEKTKGKVETLQVLVKGHAKQIRSDAKHIVMLDFSTKAKSDAVERSKMLIQNLRGKV